LYWVLLLLTLLADSTALAACRVALSVAYIWSGIQKFNGRFFHVVPSWFVAPAERWYLPSVLIEVLRWMVIAAPVIEVGIGVGIWVPGLRKTAIMATVAVHLMALLFLGPLGYNYNWVVWPWNLAMMGLVWSLFGVRNEELEIADKKPAPKTSHRPAPLLKKSLAQLMRSKPALIALGLYSLLPLLSFFGRWDSYFSFSLYSENAAVANVFISQDFGDRLPQRLRPYVQKFPLAYDPEHQGPYTFGFQAWGYEELHVPPISELRNFRSVFQFLRSYSREESDLRMIVGPRAGPVIFYQGDTQEFLMPKR